MDKNSNQTEELRVLLKKIGRTFSLYCQTFYKAYRFGTRNIPDFFRHLVSEGLVKDLDNSKEDHSKGDKQKEDRSSDICFKPFISDTRCKELFYGDNPGAFLKKNIWDRFGRDTFKSNLEEIGEEEADSNPSDIMERLCLEFKGYINFISPKNCSTILSMMFEVVVSDSIEQYFSIGIKRRAHGKRLNVYQKQKGECFWCHKPLSLQKDAANYLRAQTIRIDGKRTDAGFCPVCKAKFEAKGIPTIDRAGLTKQMEELMKVFKEALRQVSIILGKLSENRMKTVKALNELMNSSFGFWKTVFEEYPAIENEKTENE